MQPRREFTKEGIEKLYGREFIGGNSVKLLWRGTDASKEIMAAVKGARKLICLQFYIYRNDETGTALAELLKQKVSEGVEVYVLYDHLGSFWTPKGFWQGLRQAGINVRASYPFMWLSPRRYFRRDHRKLITIDSTLAFTGGLNIANEYWGTAFRKKRPWRDTGVLIEGPAAADLTKRFFDAWCRLCREPISYAPVPSPPAGGLDVLPIFSSSRVGKRRMRRLLYYSIFHADSYIALTTAYFIPGRHMVQALANAVGRGVRVSLLVPGKSDVMSARYASGYFYDRLLSAGVRIYRYNGEMLHAKSYVFDAEWCVTGSANLDMLSLRHNDEGNVGILDREFASGMLEVFERDISDSSEILPGQWRERPLSDRLLERFFSLFRQRL